MEKIITKPGYSYNDLTIIPAKLSGISSRSQVNPFDVNDMLPIFASPMSTVVSEENLKNWIENKIYPIIPRNIPLYNRLEKMRSGYWVAMSLNETIDVFIDNEFYNIGNVKICIDIANGHMKKLINVCKKIKEIYGPKVTIMTGNIANPETIYCYENCGIDYVRVSIGSGSGCLTSPQTGMHYPIASLIYECAKRKKNIKIIADGGIRTYGDVIKALALGADYVMIGSVFASLWESAAEWENDIPNYIKDSSETDIRKYIKENGLYKYFYGMSTKKAQMLIKSNESNLKTSEGIHKLVKCSHTIKQWTENMEDYLRSAMSYCNSKNLKYFRENACLIVNSISEINSLNK